MTFSRKLTVYSLYLTSLECALAIVYLYRIPADPKNAWLWGLSAARLVWILGMFVLGVSLYLIGQYAARGEPWTVKTGAWLERRLSDPRYLVSALIVLFGMGISGGYLFYLTSIGVWQGVQSIMERMAPLILWAAVVALQYGLILIYASRRTLRWRDGEALSAWLKHSLWGFILVGALWAVAAISGLGLNPDVVAWGAADTPLLFWQVCAVSGVVLFLILIWIAFPQTAAWKHATTAGFLFLWLAAAGLWLSTPLKPNYYALEPVPPNEEYYPYSDAAVHDIIAQNLLIGEGLGGFGGRVVRRPLYTLFLAGIHLLAGQDYLRCVTLQVLVLALFPAVVFLLGGLLHSRLAGFLAASLLILQEHNAIRLSGVINVSHAKLFMSDLPSALLIALFCLMAVDWFRRGGDGWRRPLCLGGVLGALMLIRPQSAVLGVVPVVLLFFSAWKKPRRWLQGVLLFVIGVTLCITPWLWRNWRISGEWLFDEPSNAQIGLVAQRYASDLQPNAEYTNYQPQESPGQYSQRMMRLIVEFAVSHPREVASFVSAHFVHNLVTLAASFPLSLSGVGLEDTVRQASFWLHDMDDGNPVRPVFPNPWLLGANLALLALGIVSVKGRGKTGFLAGLVPLLTYLAYDASNALARNSGWRFMLPADWIGWLFFAIGLGEIIRRLLALFPWREALRFTAAISCDEDPSAIRARPAPVYQAFLIPLLILCLGASLPLGERVFSRRYPPLNKDELLRVVQAYPLDETQQSDLEVMFRLIGDEKVHVLRGRALYPRFYKAGQGIAVGTPSPLTQVRDYPRLTFELIGPQDTRVVLISQRPPATFVNGSDVYTVGCYGLDAFYPYLVIVVDGQRNGQLYFYTRGEVTESPCF